MTWQLIVRTIHGEHFVAIAGNEPDAKAALDAVQTRIGAHGVVQIAERLALRAEDITAAQIVERYVLSDRRHRRDTRLPRGHRPS
jgi:hypothetical protein